ncbi:MAG: PspC domain-containing protein [Corynebacterium sp.]|nr:PspC domain-containing protein [Corynebacterium sp.]
MNTHETSPYSSSPRPSSSSDSTDVLAQMWATRPTRIPESQGGKGPFAGVCEGIAVRFQIDPTLVRVAFVVSALTFGGGLITYLLLWLIMPRFSKPTSPLDDVFSPHKLKKFAVEQGLSNPTELKSESSTGIVLMIFLFMSLTSGGIISEVDTGAAMLWLTPMAAGAIWYLLHRRLPVPPAGLLTSSPQNEGVNSSSTGPSINFDQFEPVEGYPFPAQHRTPPTWDPLGAAPDIWHLPDLPESPAPTPKKSKFSWLKISAIIFAVCTAIAVATTFGFTLFSAAAWNEASSAGSMSVGSLSVAPRTIAELDDVYETHVGSLDIDLSNTTGIDTLTTERTVELFTNVGSIDLALPKDVPVNLICDNADIGSSNCTDITNPGAKLTIEVSTSLGSTTIDYGATAPAR